MNNNSEYEQEYDAEHTDGEIDVRSTTKSIKSIKSIGVASTGSDSSFNAPATEKSMVKYHLNGWGIPVSLGAICFYGYKIFNQVTHNFSLATTDLVPITVALRLRYIGAFIYFFACLCNSKYVFEMRNPESPLIVSTVLEIYYLMSEEGKPEESGDITMNMLQFVIPVAVLVVCLLRRRPIWRLIMNPWSKDKTELLKIIKEARDRVLKKELF